MTELEDRIRQWADARAGEGDVPVTAEEVLHGDPSGGEVERQRQNRPTRRLVAAAVAVVLVAGSAAVAIMTADDDQVVADGDGTTTTEFTPFDPVTLETPAVPFDAAVRPERALVVWGSPGEPVTATLLTPDGPKDLPTPELTDGRSWQGLQPMSVGDGFALFGLECEIDPADMECRGDALIGFYDTDGDLVGEQRVGDLRGGQAWATPAGDAVLVADGERARLATPDDVSDLANGNPLCADEDGTLLAVDVLAPDPSRPEDNVTGYRAAVLGGDEWMPLGDVIPSPGLIRWPFCTPGAAMAGSSYITAEGPVPIADAETIERIQPWLGQLGHSDIVGVARSGELLLSIDADDVARLGDGLSGGWIGLSNDRRIGLRKVTDEQLQLVDVSGQEDAVESTGSMPPAAVDETDVDTVNPTGPTRSDAPGSDRPMLWVSEPSPFPGDLLAVVGGTVGLLEQHGCFVIDMAGEQRPVVWPAGTTLTDDGDIRLRDGTIVAVGDEVGGGGGIVEPGEGRDIPTACLPPSGQIVVFNNGNLDGTVLDVRPG